ncbi:YihY/virulence factor BrkB family protein [Lolliginicoccus suaedae]|uniref:YihY/virulence factor BrkB family protein n=1 Tax=Lolliginicoccus suaedae TaxID=2605429 RepID=UPI0011ED7BED|nr:YihY/virulence factor BrkB family protein [Lolliginicoccus suaedae]
MSQAATALVARAATLPRLVGSLAWQTIARAWNDSIFALAASAAFWQVLSLPPLLLGLLGAVAYVADWFGPDTVAIIESRIVSFSGDIFTDSVVDQIIAPTISDVLQQGRLDLVSIGFLLSLWAGSSAVASFVDAIARAHEQNEHRHPVWHRLFAVLLYVGFLVLAVVTLPLVALGPALLLELIPASWGTVFEELVATLYYPAVGILLIIGLTLLYKVALPRRLPWHRLLAGSIVAGAVFYAASAGLRFYLSGIARTGYTYGALATPIAFLLFAFFLGFSIVIGAEFNAVVQERWPARATRIEQMRKWLAEQSEQSGSEDGPASARFYRLASGSVRVLPATRARDESKRGKHEASEDADDDISGPPGTPGTGRG